MARLPEAGVGRCALVPVRNVLAVMDQAIALSTLERV